MKDLKELEKKYAELGKEIEALKSEVQYPIYCLSKVTGAIVKFDGLKSGVFMKKSEDFVVGKLYKYLTPHTNTENWQQLPVCPKTGFYDMQPIWCWEDNYTHTRTLMFFDAKNSDAFSYYGRRNGSNWDNYAPFEGEWLDWMNEAFNTLEK